MERAGRLALDLAAALLHTEASALGELHPCVDNSFCGVPVRGMVCAFVQVYGESLRGGTAVIMLFSYSHLTSLHQRRRTEGIPL